MPDPQPAAAVAPAAAAASPFEAGLTISPAGTPRPSPSPGFATPSSGPPGGALATGAGTIDGASRRFQLTSPMAIRIAIYVVIGVAIAVFPVMQAG